MENPVPRGRLQLSTYGPALGLPSISVQCTHALAYLRLCGLKSPGDFALVDVRGARLEPHAALPELHVAVDAPGIRYSRELFAELVAMGFDLDSASGASARDIADGEAYAALLVDGIGPALLQAWWLDQENYDECVRPAYADMLPFPVSYYHPWQLQRRVHSYLVRRGLTSAFEARKRAERAFDSLAVRLGDRPYFGGQRPSSLDAVAVAYLLTVDRCPLPRDSLRRALRAHTNLSQFCDRVGEECFGDESSLSRIARGPLPQPRPVAMSEAGAVDEADVKKRRSRQRSRRFLVASLGTFVAYVVAHYVPVLLILATGMGGEDDDDDDGDDSDDADDDDDE